ncbi:MAG: hypothetical protein J0H82_21530 [Alphaproteobacteria bacterium]|nr:hypothetical protein [Alphaproteobacteria bacterium]
MFARTQTESSVSRLPAPVDTGLSPKELAQGQADLEIILQAMELRPDQKFAVTGLADTVLHSLLDKPEMARYMQEVFGSDAFPDHNAEAWGTEEYAEAWRNTRRAFAEHGIELEIDPAATRTDGREAKICFLSAGRAGGREAAICFLSVGRQPN